MKYLKLKHEYHDAALSAVRLTGGDLTLVADLDGHWNNKCEQRAYLTFHNVKNMDAVRARFSLAVGESSTDLSDDIIAVVKVDKTRYLVDLSKAGALEIDCRGVSEI